MYEHTTIGVDQAKSVFELAVFDRPEAVSRRRRLTHATIAMEASGVAHVCDRRAESFGDRFGVKGDAELDRMGAIGRCQERR